MAKNAPRCAHLVQRDAALGILRKADLIVQQSGAVLKPFDLTGPQFNILRILRGAPEGLSCGQIGDRMIHRDPDITRLLDRMEARNLIERHRSDQDRRVVFTKISSCGLALLEQADPALDELHIRQFEGFTEEQLHNIIELLQKVAQG